jgi:hypothetical protein
MEREHGGADDHIYARAWSDARQRASKEPSAVFLGELKGRFSARADWPLDRLSGPRKKQAARDWSAVGAN